MQIQLNAMLALLVRDEYLQFQQKSYSQKFYNF